MKHLPTIAGALLGLAFIIFGLNFFFKFMPAGGPHPEGSPAAMFFGALFISKFLTTVKVLEIIGGILVAIPKTRNWGLLVLGPVVINILLINILIIGEGAIFKVPVIAISALSAYLLWHERKKFLGLLN